MLGNELIHLHYRFFNNDLSFEENEQYYASVEWSNPHKRPYSSPWGHIICEDDCPEDSPDQKEVIEWDGEEEMRIYWYKPHELCCSDNKTMRLNVLRTCRQAYVEANNILWATNTFSFENAVAFTRFMMTRTIHQKRLIRNLRLEMEWYLDDGASWNSSLSKTLVNSLSGLRSLRLRIEHNVSIKQYDMLRRIGFVETSGLCKGLRKLSTLPLTNVEVVVRPSRFYPEGFWTEDNRKEVAEGLKKMLLAPKLVEVSPKTQE